MLEWWSENGPPVYIAVAAYLGIIKDPAEKKVGDLNELAKLAGPGGMIQ
jgi:hypothetical protein